LYNHAGTSGKSAKQYDRIHVVVSSRYSPGIHDPLSLTAKSRGRRDEMQARRPVTTLFSKTLAVAKLFSKTLAVA
jgi:hypothetical protein